MSRNIELLAPGGDVEAIKAAVIAGANAVYCGLDNFNARNRAANLSFDELSGILRLAHQYDCEVFLTLNVVILEPELNSLIKLLNKLVNTGIDGIIVQDLGVFNLVKKHFPTLNIHASTQLTTHNEGQVLFLAKIGASRVNLSRELNIGEIKSLTTLAHKHDVLTEVFVHGALCIAFSGQCYSSSVSVGNSGNRGSCSQACRDEYEITAAGNRFPLNLKDNSAYFDLPALVDAQVDSLKLKVVLKMHTMFIPSLIPGGSRSTRLLNQVSYWPTTLTCTVYSTVTLPTLFYRATSVKICLSTTLVITVLTMPLKTMPSKRIR